MSVVLKNLKKKFISFKLKFFLQNLQKLSGNISQKLILNNIDFFRKKTEKPLDSENELGVPNSKGGLSSLLDFIEFLSKSF